eukprot:4666028-Prymnesium_polylepis.1
MGALIGILGPKERAFSKFGVAIRDPEPVYAEVLSQPNAEATAAAAHLRKLLRFGRRRARLSASRALWTARRRPLPDAHGRGRDAAVDSRVDLAA